MSDASMNKATEASESSLAEMPEIDETRFRRVPGRGHHAGRSTGNIVVIDGDIWQHFDSAAAVNAALRAVVDAARRQTR
jgi:hypothetical protein